MAPFVEANSLSLITQLASNPPRYPRNPTEPKKQPLVLYIAKVPGSRDIILTPFKPRRKNVTAEDVASSLYYLHLQNPNDEALLEEYEELLQEDEGSDAEVPPPVPERKPLPNQPFWQDEVRLQRDGGNIVETPRPVPERKPLPKSVSLPPSLGSWLESPPRLPPRPSDPTSREVRPPLPVRRPPSPKNVSPERRPLGPRPLQSPEPNVPHKLLSGEENQPRNSNTRELPATPIEMRPPLPDRPWTPTGHRPPVMNIRNDLVKAAASKSSLKKKFSITMIRRDPASGAQWNVGLITNQTTDDTTGLSNPAGQALLARPDDGSLSIHLSTPGYSQFHSSRVPTSSAISASTPFPPTSTTFQRHLYSDPPNPTAAAANYATTKPRAIPKHYTFTSPWHGRCAFTTGRTGRSLKCKHTLAPQPGNSNVTTTPTTTTTAPASAPAPVSELRFNIPAAALFGSSKTTGSAATNALLTSSSSSSSTTAPRRFGQKLRQKLAAPSPGSRGIGSSASTPSAAAKARTGTGNNNNARLSLEYPPHQRQRQLHHHQLHKSLPAIPITPRRPSTSSSTASSSGKSTASTTSIGSSATPHLDLRLGREAAGGGKHGSRAKLGKLIVWDEGLKMLDLVVAANMGVWWVAWDP